MQRVQQSQKKRNEKLVKFEQIINMKSENSIKVDDFLILNPHNYSMKYVSK